MKKYIFLLSLLSLLLVSCKPTERNYREAYDAARARREAVDDAIPVPGGALESLDGPRLRVVDGDSLLFLSIPLALDGGELGAIGPVGGIGAFSVAVGVYSLPTNPVAQAAALRKEGCGAFVAKGADGKYYCIASTFPTIAGAKDFIATFRKKNPGYPTVGLPGITIVER